MVKDICYAQKYQSQEGEKTKWIKCGVLIEKDGKQSIKLDVMPCGEFNGFLNVFEQRDKGQSQGGRHDSREPF